MATPQKTKSTSQNKDSSAQNNKSVSQSDTTISPRNRGNVDREDGGCSNTLAKFLFIIVSGLMIVVLVLYIVDKFPGLNWHAWLFPNPAPGPGPAPAPAPAPVPVIVWKPTTIDNPPPVQDAERLKEKFAGKNIKLEFWGGDPSGLGFDLNTNLVTRFKNDTGIDVHIADKTDTNTTSAYASLQGMIIRKDLPDVLVLDVTWLGEVADQLRELPEFDETSKLYSVSYKNAANNIIAMPWSLNFGVLFYRSDLIDTPPKTWEELETRARDTSKSKGIQGFVWQGADYEGLTCNILEWLASSGGGEIIKDGAVNITKPAAQKVFTRAQSWIGTISSQDVLGYTEDEARKVFEGGNAVFLRSWPTDYVAVSKNAPSLAFKVAPLPSEEGVKPVGTLGGSALGIYKDTKNADAASAFVSYMTSPNTQEYRALFGFFIPSIPTIFVGQNPDDLNKITSYSPLAKIIGFIQNNEIELKKRPSDVLGGKYNEASAELSKNVHQILSDKKVDITQVLSQTQQAIQLMLQSQPK